MPSDLSTIYLYLQLTPSSLTSTGGLADAAAGALDRGEGVAHAVESLRVGGALMCFLINRWDPSCQWHLHIFVLFPPNIEAMVLVLLPS